MRRPVLLHLFPSLSLLSHALFKTPHPVTTPYVFHSPGGHKHISLFLFLPIHVQMHRLHHSFPLHSTNVWCYTWDTLSHCNPGQWFSFSFLIFFFLFSLLAAVDSWFFSPFSAVKLNAALLAAVSLGFLLFVETGMLCYLIPFCIHPLLPQMSLGYDPFKFFIRHTANYVRHLANVNCHSSSLDLGKDVVSLAGGVVNLLKICNFARKKKKTSGKLAAQLAWGHMNFGNLSLAFPPLCAHMDCILSFIICAPTHCSKYNSGNTQILWEMFFSYYSCLVHKDSVWENSVLFRFASWYLGWVQIPL